MRWIGVSIGVLGLAVSLLGSCQGEWMTVSSRSDAIKTGDILEQLANQCDFTLFYADEKSKERARTIPVGIVSLQNRTLEEIIGYLLTNANIHYRFEDGVLRLSYIATETFKVDYLDSQRTGSSNTDVKISASSGTMIGGNGAGSGGLGGSSAQGQGIGDTGAEITTEERFNFWDDLSQDLKMILSRPEDDYRQGADAIVIHRKSGLVTVSGTKRQLDRVRAYLDEVLSSLRKQVLIDVKVLSVTLSENHTVGIDWSNFGLGANLDVRYDSTSLESTLSSTSGTSSASSLVIDGGTQFTMDGFLNFLKQYGTARSLSNPKVMAINNQPTMISVGDNINYRIEQSYVTGQTTSTVSTSYTVGQIFVGVLLDITAQIDDDGFITLRINPSISELKYSEDAIKQEEIRQLPPDTVTRRISSVVRVGDSDVIVLGGLISATKSREDNKVPWLGDIPVLGWLFHSQAIKDVTTEIVFVLTPRVIDTARLPRLTDLGFAVLQEEMQTMEGNRSLPVRAAKGPEAEKAAAWSLPAVQTEQEAR